MKNSRTPACCIPFMNKKNHSLFKGTKAGLNKPADQDSSLF